MKRYEIVDGEDGLPLTELPIPPWEERFMLKAYRAARSSKDNRTKVGAVLVRDKMILMEGYNGFPRNVNDFDKGRQERPTKYFYTAHAEENIFTNCCREGISTKGGTLYSIMRPCSACARMIINAGIVRVILHKGHLEASENHSGEWGESFINADLMFREAKVEVDILDSFLGEFTLIDGTVYCV